VHGEDGVGEVVCSVSTAASTEPESHAMGITGTSCCVEQLGRFSRDLGQDQPGFVHFVLADRRRADGTSSIAPDYPALGHIVLEFLMGREFSGIGFCLVDIELVASVPS
jgi:hypothetical protein